MEKIELWQLAKYLTYELKVKGITLRSTFEVGGLDGSVVLLVGRGRVDLFDIMPYVRPLSDLIMPDENGVTDMERLAKITDSNFEKVLDSFTYSEGVAVGIYSCRYWRKDGLSYRLSFDLTNLRFFTKYAVSAINQLQLFEFLFSRHYDVFGWIEKGLALSIHDKPF